MSISERVLKSIELGSDLLNAVDGLKYLPYQMLWGSNLQGYSRDSVQAVLSRVVKQGLVTKRIDQGKVYLALTELGANFLKKKQSRVTLNLETSSKKWDGVYRFVFFDIPERDRSTRDSLRNALKAIEAVCWQKSVWITTENITQEINRFIDENALSDYCSVLEAKEIYNSKIKKLLEPS